MRKLDYRWMDKEEWYHLNENCVFVLNDDAPPEAQESYKHFLEQLKTNNFIDDEDEEF